MGKKFPVLLCSNLNNWHSWAMPNAGGKVDANGGK